jgi:hypothetical protein
MITARCQPDGPVTAAKLQTFGLNRSTGNLTVIAPSVIER